jgi:hypothetical protein
MATLAVVAGAEPCVRESLFSACVASVSSGRLFGRLSSFQGGSMFGSAVYVRLALLLLLLSAASVFLGAEPWVPG